VVEQDRSRRGNGAPPAPGAYEAAPAKINLALLVLGRRPDGYHELQSLVVFADVADEIEAVPSAHDSLTLAGPFAASLSNGEANLVSRALAAWRQRWPGRAPDGLSITLRKNLPVAAGLGGGSADAAAILRLLAAMSADPPGLPELSALAAAIGADVPACLVSRPLELRGIGEIVTPLRSFPACHLVLVNPLEPVVTGEVFRRLECRANAPLPPLPQPLSRPELGLWLEETRNDLEAPAMALLPVISALVASMGAAQGCMLARMTGSGGSVFGLFGSGALAHQAAHDLRERWPGYWVAAAPVILPG
jgi:4-diphosphocytidyl-2-C-methyl-D-erythritol kinase